MPTGRRLFRFWAFMASLLFSAACGQQAPEPTDSPHPALRSSVGPVSAEPQRQGVPEKGYAALVNAPYISCGIPYQAYKKVAQPPPESHRLPDRKGRNAELPYNRTYYRKANGVELVTGNCLTCHAGFFNGELVIGLGNENLDFTNDISVGAENLGAYVRGELEIAEWRKWADRMAAAAPYVITNTVGVNPAIDLTWAFIAHRDPKTLAWSQELLMKPPPKYVLPVSMPPWWRMSKKNAMFYTASGRGDHARHMILGTVFCADSVQEAQVIDEYAPDIRAFISSLTAPVYPFAIDHKVAGDGLKVFEKNCSRCHGTYGKEETYPNLVIAIDEVGTDPALAESGTAGKEDRFTRWVSESFYGELSRLAPAPGYIAPPLDGIWATAPYLHNGSVPTIEALLESPKRPEFWARSFDSRDYDDKTLGWNYTALTYGKDGAKDETERKLIYDTSLRGYSNAGHTFGDALSQENRLELTEYLKTL